MKREHNLSTIHKRGILAATEECLLSAMALNLKRMVKAIFPAMLVRTPLKKCSLTADDGASSPAEWCTASAEMVHGGRRHGAPGRHAGNYSGIPLRFRMDSPSIWMV